MKVLIINASPHEKGHNNIVSEELQIVFNTNNIDTELFWLGQQHVKSCLGCDMCMKLDKCVQDDDLVNDLAKKIYEADGLIVCAPVYFGGPNGNLCNAFDRIFYSHTVKNQMFEGKPAGAITICNTMGAETALMGIYRYFNTCQMPIISNTGYPTLTMKMVEEKDDRYHTVINNTVKNMINTLKAKG